MQRRCRQGGPGAATRWTAGRLDRTRPRGRSALLLSREKVENKKTKAAVRGGGGQFGVERECLRVATTAGGLVLRDNLVSARIRV
jgi:hypothetical protein